MSVEDAFAAALETTPLLPRDRVTVQLALRYAEALDDMFERLAADPDTTEDPATHARVILEITRIGGRFEACLDRLGMSPGARPNVYGGEREGEREDPAAAALAALQRDAAGTPAGVDYAALVDPAVTGADAAD